jgi:hypothetical protein
MFEKALGAFDGEEGPGRHSPAGLFLLMSFQTLLQRHEEWDALADVCRGAAGDLAAAEATAPQLAHTLLRLGAAELALGNVRDGQEALWEAADTLQRCAPGAAAGGGGPAGDALVMLAAELRWFEAVASLYGAEGVAAVDEVAPHLHGVRAAPTCARIARRVGAVT